MSLQNNDFTVERGIEYQQEDLKGYRSKVTPKVYRMLVEECNRQNEKPMKNGYEVFRGGSIDTFFKNIRL